MVQIPQIHDFHFLYLLNNILNGFPSDSYSKLTLHWWENGEAISNQNIDFFKKCKQKLGHNFI